MATRIFLVIPVVALDDPNRGILPPYDLANSPKFAVNDGDFLGAVTDDASKGWNVGSTVINQGNTTVYTCVNPAIGAAVWASY